MTFYYQQQGDTLSGVADLRGYGLLHAPQQLDFSTRPLLNDVALLPLAKKFSQASTNGFDSNFSYFLNKIVTYDRPGITFGDVGLILKSDRALGQIAGNLLRFKLMKPIPLRYSDLRSLRDVIRLMERKRLTIIVFDNVTTQPVPTEEENSLLAEIGEMIQARQDHLLPVILTESHGIFPAQYKSLQDKLLGRPIVTVIRSLTTRDYDSRLAPWGRETAFRVWDRFRQVVGYEVGARPDHQDVAIGFGSDGTRTLPMNLNEFHPMAPFGQVSIWFPLIAWPPRDDLLNFTCYAMACVGLKASERDIDHTKGPNVDSLMRAINEPEVCVHSAINRSPLRNSEKEVCYFLFSVMDMLAHKPSKSEILTLLSAQTLFTYHNLGDQFYFDAYESTQQFKRQVLSDPFGAGIEFRHLPSGMTVSISKVDDCDCATWTIAPKAPRPVVLQPWQVKLEYDSRPEDRNLKIEDVDKSLTKVSLERPRPFADDQFPLFI